VSFWLTLRLQVDVDASHDPIPKPSAATDAGEMLV